MTRPLSPSPGSPNLISLTTDPSDSSTPHCSPAIAVTATTLPLQDIVDLEEVDAAVAFRIASSGSADCVIRGVPNGPRLAKGRRETLLIELFDSLDWNGSGFIGSDEVDPFISNLGPSQTLRG